MGGGGYHYAKVTDIVEDLFGGSPIVIVKVPVLKCDKAVTPASLEPARKPQSSTKNPDKAGGPGESPGDIDR